MIPGIGSMGGAELLILLVILLILLFGAKRLPALGRSFEIGMRLQRPPFRHEDEAAAAPTRRRTRRKSPRTRARRG